MAEEFEESNEVLCKNVDLVGKFEESTEVMIVMEEKLKS